MLKNITQLEHKIGDKIFHFACDMDSKIEDAKEALAQFMAYVIQIENSIKAKQQQPSTESSQVQPVSPDQAEPLSPNEK